MSGFTLSPDLYLVKDTAIETLAFALKSGCLTLFIGAGISKSASKEFPKWNELVMTCCAKNEIDFNISKAGLDENDTKNINNEYLLKKMEEVKHKISNESLYINNVKEALYENIIKDSDKDKDKDTKQESHNDPTYDYVLMHKELLIAIGSIIMGSIRGNTDCVINYNFDDLFEWYLDQHGFKTQVISKFPCTIYKSDVNIYHPHGFLPLQKKYKGIETKKIVLSKNEYETVISEEVNPWNEFQRFILSTKLGLFIGMSGDDKHISSLCNYVYNKDVSTNQKRILAFIILIDNEENRSNEQENLRRGLINTYIKNYSELPSMLLSICRKATEEI